MPNTYQELHDKYQKVLEEMVAANNLAIENLTREQFVSALKQAIACGDFQRLVRYDGTGQAVIYTPFAEVQQLKAHIKFLEERLRSPEEPPDRDAHVYDNADD